MLRTGAHCGASCGTSLPTVPTSAMICIDSSPQSRTILWRSPRITTLCVWGSTGRGRDECAIEPDRPVGSPHPAAACESRVLRDLPRWLAQPILEWRRGGPGPEGDAAGAGRESAEGG